MQNLRHEAAHAARPTAGSSQENRLPPSTGARASVLQRLLDRIEATWPELRFHHARLIDDGGDHQIVVLDDLLAVRIPRNRGRSLAFEAAALRLLAPITELEVPRYTLSADGRIARYAFLGGRTLTAQRFWVMHPAAKKLISLQLGRFLSSLHGISPQALAPAASWPRPWTQPEVAAHDRRTVLPLLRRFRPELTAKIEEFYQVFEHDAPEQEVVLHGDLVADHLLIGGHRGVLTGIIDFSDIGLGDAAYDLMGLWRFGRAMVEATLVTYKTDCNKSALLERSRRAYIRYRLNRFSEAIMWRSAAVRVEDR